MLNVCASAAVGDGLLSICTEYACCCEMSWNGVDREVISSLCVLAVCSGVLVWSLV